MVERRLPTPNVGVQFLPPLSTMKFCRKCGEEKDESRFYTSPKNSDGLYHECKLCLSSSKPTYFTHSWYQENFSEEDLALFSRLKNLCTKAKLRKREFDPSVNWEHLFDLWTDQNGKCALSGLPLSIEVNDPHIVSLDRKDSSQGYVVGNLQLVSATVNRMKQEFNEGFFLEMCGHITNRQSKKLP